MTKKRVLFSVLFERNPPGACIRSIVKLAMAAGAYGYEYLDCPYGRTDYVRNWLCNEFIAQTGNPDDTLIMCDNDHIHTPEELAMLASRDLPVVGALAHRRGPPFDPVFFVADEQGGMHSMYEWEPGKLYVGSMVSPACIAIKRGVFETLEAKGYPRPWWRYVYTDNSMAMPSEDMWFGRICNEAGIKHHVDTSIVIPHLTDGWIDSNVFLEYKKDHPTETIQHEVGVLEHEELVIA